ncbi:DUF805 domain-containing protein [Aestuariibius insulae]|uniref:DUF805 domain-containing protein n=1 Tax=Aestuariibius insulae TaxID=2058287 RepID=UPI00398ED3A4
MLALSDTELTLLTFALLFAGSLIGILLLDNGDHLRRGPYFAWYGFLTFAIAGVSFLFVFTIDAVVAQLIWALFLLAGIWLLIAGAVLGRMSAARARDMGWSRWTGLLSLVPLICLVLLFTKSSDPDSDDPHLLAGVPGGLIGVAFFGMARAAVPYSETLALKRETQMPLSAAEEAIYFDFHIRTSGIDTYLQNIADQAVLPVQVDEVTTLAQIETSGHVMTRLYLLEKEETDIEMTDDWAADTVEYLCGHAFFSALLDAGAVIRERFAYEDGAPIGLIEVSTQDCAKPV